MPFDGNVAPENIYRSRRRRAAALWRTVPEENFDMIQWKCGTTACAAGWLANEKFDGWHWDPICPSIPLPPACRHLDLSTFWDELGAFFDLTPFQAMQLFTGCDDESLSRRVFTTPTQVGDRLLEMPYATIGAQTHAI